LRKYVHDPDQLLHVEWPELMDEYPGHLHVDILPPYQGVGMGRKLMEAFLDQMKQCGSNGIHLGMVSSNEGAEKFYRRMGFGRFPDVLDDGVSGEQGRNGSTTYMTISL
jgi:GNAT superfamily N-acetyltransferase